MRCLYTILHKSSSVCPGVGSTEKGSARAYLTLPVAHVLAHGREVVVAVLVDREREGRDVLRLRLVEGHLGVVDCVLLFHSFAAVAPVLRPAVADEEEELRLGVKRVQLGRRVTDGRPHARRVEGRDAIDPP